MNSYPSSSSSFPQQKYSSSHPQSNALLQPGQAIQINKHLVRVEKYLSQGGYAHVYVVTTSAPVLDTTKHVLKRIAVPDANALKGVQKEVEVMQLLRGHPNIVQFIDASWNKLSNDTYEVFILMEFCQGGGIIDMMNRRLRERLTEAEILQIFVDVCEGVAAMHNLKPPLMHRDLKIENILQSSSTKYKLCDFGSATAVSKPPTTALEIRQLEADLNKHTTLQYRSPEMIDLYSRRRIDEKSDVWALGVLLYKLCYYTTPFEEHGPLAILNVQYKTPAFPVYSRRMNELIGTMLREHGAQRPSVFEILNAVHQLRGTKSQFTYEIAPPPKQPSSTPSIDASLPFRSTLLNSTNTYSGMPPLQPTRRGQVPSISSQKERIGSFRGLLPSKTANAMVSLPSEGPAILPLTMSPKTTTTTNAGTKIVDPPLKVTTNTRPSPAPFASSSTSMSSFLKRPSPSPISGLPSTIGDAFSGLDGLVAKRGETGESGRSLSEVMEAKKESRPLPRPLPSPRQEVTGKGSPVDPSLAIAEERFPSIEDLDSRQDNLFPPLDMRRAPSAPTSRFSPSSSMRGTPPFTSVDPSGPARQVPQQDIIRASPSGKQELRPAPLARPAPLQRKHRSSTLIRSPTSPTTPLLEPTTPSHNEKKIGLASELQKMQSNASTASIGSSNARSSLLSPPTRRTSTSSSGESGPEDAGGSTIPPKHLRKSRKSSVHDLVGLYSDLHRTEPVQRERSNARAPPSPSLASPSFSSFDHTSTLASKSTRPRPQSLLVSPSPVAPLKTSPISASPAASHERFRSRRNSVSELVERFEPGTTLKTNDYSNVPTKDSLSRSTQDVLRDRAKADDKSLPAALPNSPTKVATEPRSPPLVGAKPVELRPVTTIKPTPARKPPNALVALLDADKGQTPAVKPTRSESPERPFQGVGKLIQQWQQRTVNG